MDRVEVPGEHLAPTLDPGPARDDREELVELASPLEEMVGDGEAVDQATLDFGPVLGWECLEGQDVVLLVAAPAGSPLEVALDARPAIEDRPEPVTPCQRVVRLPLVLEDFQPRRPGLGRGVRGAQDWQPGREHPQDPEGAQPEHSHSDPTAGPRQRRLVHRTPPNRANARAGVRMRRSVHDRCTLTTVVISPGEFKGSPAMFASSPKMDRGMAWRTAFANDQVNELLESIDTGNNVGLRDRTLLMIVIDTVARTRAFARFRIGDHDSEATMPVNLANPVYRGKLSRRSITL